MSLKLLYILNLLLDLIIIFMLAYAISKFFHLEKRVSKLEKIYNRRPKEDVSEKVDKELSEKDMIFLLSEKGYPASEIAKITGVPIGEVELILKLKN